MAFATIFTTEGSESTEGFAAASNGILNVCNEIEIAIKIGEMPESRDKKQKQKEWRKQ